MAASHERQQICSYKLGDGMGRLFISTNIGVMLLHLKTTEGGAGFYLKKYQLS